MARPYSESSPEKLIWNPSFWFKQKDFFLVVVVAGLILWCFWEYTYGQKDPTTLIFNLVIHFLGILGIYNGMNFLAEIEVNTYIVIDIEEKGNKYLEYIEKNPGKKSPLDTLKRNILPNNPTYPNPAMIRLFQRIIMEAKDRQFESSVSLVQPYQDESYEKMLQISNFQKLALRLGILGTFIGLIMAIKDLASNGIGEDITPLIKSLFGSLYLAFSTSVAGLEVAILLGFLLSILHGKQKKYFRVMEDAVLTMLSIARNADHKDLSSSEFSQMSNSLNKFSDKMYDYNQTVNKSLGSAEQKIVGLTGEIEQGLKQLIQTKAEFDGFLQSISDTQKQFLDDMEHIYDVISLKKISDELKTSIIDAGKIVSNRVENTTEKVDTQTEQIQEGINKLVQTHQELSQFLDEIRQTQEKFINELRKSYDVASINEVAKALNNNSSQMNRLAKVIQENANTSLWTRFRKLF